MKYWSSHFSVHRHKVCRVTRTRVRGRKHHIISITLRSHGGHAFWAVIAVVIWVMRMRKTWCSPSDAAVRHAVTCRPDIIGRIGWSWVEVTHGEAFKDVNVNSSQSWLHASPTDCFRPSIKEGAKQPCSCRAWFSLLSPTEDIEMWSWVWGQLSPKIKKKKEERLPKIFVFFESSGVGALLCPHLHALRILILDFLSEEELSWLVFFSACFTLRS